MDTDYTDDELMAVKIHLYSLRVRYM